MTTPLVESVVSNRRVEWEIMRDQLDYINKIAMQDLMAVFDRARELDPWAARAYLTEAMDALVNTYGGTAAELSAQWWDEIVADDMFFAQPAELPTYNQLTKEVAWGTAASTREDVLSRLALLMQKHIFGAHRDTVSINSLNRNIGWQRYAQADSCAFCRLLASRGAVYTSQASSRPK